MTTKKINSKKRYSISLKKAVKVGQTWLAPSNKNIVSGVTLEAIQGDVSEYHEVK